MQMRTLLLTALPALALGACTGTQNRGLESVHQPVVSRTDVALDVNAGPNGLAPGETRRLGEWLATMRLGYGDRIAVDDPNGLSLAVRDDVAREAARFGLLLSNDAPVTSAPVAAGTTRIVVTRARASVPGCPDFSRMHEPNFDNHTSSNHGCGVNANLAAMIANPTDLVRGQPGADVYDNAVGSRAIFSYRKAAPTGAGGTTIKSESTGGR